MYGTELKKRQLTAIALRRLEECPVATVSKPKPFDAVEMPTRPATLEELIATNNILLNQMLKSFNHAIKLWASQQEIFSRSQQVTVTTSGTLLYENNFPYPLTIIVYNMDPAQDLSVAHKGSTVDDSIPVRPESSEKFTIQEGDSLYGRVASGSVDVRFQTTQQRRI